MANATFISYVNGMAPENAGTSALRLGKAMSLLANSARFPFRAPSLDEKLHVYPPQGMRISEMKPERVIVYLMNGKTECHEDNEKLPPEQYVALLVQLFRLRSNDQKDAIDGGLRLRGLTMSSFLEKHVKPSLRQIVMKMELESVERAEMIEGNPASKFPAATEFATPRFLAELRGRSNQEAVKSFFEKGPGFLGC